MNIKSFISKNKKVIISCVICFLVGAGITISGNISDQEISDMQAKNTEISAQISQKDSLLEADKKELNNLKVTLSEYQTKKDDIEKAKEEKLEKEQEEKEKKEQAEAEAAKKKQEAESAKSVAASSNSSNADNTKSSDNKQVGAMVWRTKTGKKYHSTSHCGNTHSAQATEITLSEAQAEGLTPCSKCY